MNSLNKEIRFGTKQHKEVVDNIRALERMSNRQMSERYKEYRKMEDKAVFYVKTNELDALRDTNKKNGVQDYVTIDVPYSYGMMMSAHTYITTVFLSRNPLHQFTARHGESQQSVMAVESLMDYQTMVGEHIAPYYIWFYDALKYGLGIVGTYWVEEDVVVSNIVEEDVTFMGIPTGKKEKRKKVQRVPGYHGNKLYNVKPYEFVPDPRVPINRFQDGEFCGRKVAVSWNQVAKGKVDGIYFNVDALKKVTAKGGRSGSYGVDVHTEEGSTNVKWPDTQATTVEPNHGKQKDYVQLLEMTIELIPTDWGLGKTDYPEKWIFTLANDTVLIGARPLGEYHNKFPFEVIEQEIEGYALFKRGMMEQLQPMNDIISWLFNSHFYNVRAALNNQLVYDPSRVNQADLLSKEPGKMIRLKPDAYGSDVRTVVTQLKVADITRSNISDWDKVGELMQRVQGVTDNVMGLVNAGGRKSATEVRTSSSFSTNRLKTIAEYMSAGGFSRLAQMMLQSTQQHYDEDLKLKIVGDLPQSEPFVDVTPESIVGFYDFVPVDGTMPVDRFAQANLWKEILTGITQIPGIAQQYDLTGMFKFMTSLAGIRNVDQFRIKISPDEQLRAAAEAGDAVPIDGSVDVNLNEPSQIRGLGPTG